MSAYFDMFMLQHSDEVFHQPLVVTEYMAFAAMQIPKESVACPSQVFEESLSTAKDNHCFSMAQNQSFPSC
ncbi:hypothetical protein RIF29_29001 [Crotalaria pallida]|uniref:Uncharacterized protein n=1 Tax=Crotalaria pallida TaxID=3830 RepID=A0AAN9EKG1_CROPI